MIDIFREYMDCASRQHEQDLDELEFLLKQEKEKNNKTIEYINSLSSKGSNCEIYYDIKQEILKRLNGDKQYE